MSVLYQFNTEIRIFMMLATSLVEMSLHLGHIISTLYHPAWLNSTDYWTMIYHTLGKQANHYTKETI